MELIELHNICFDIKNESGIDFIDLTALVSWFTETEGYYKGKMFSNGPKIVDYKLFNYAGKELKQRDITEDDKQHVEGFLERLDWDNLITKYNK